MSTAIEAGIPGAVSDFHGYVCHTFDVDGHEARIVEPKETLPGKPWVWRTMFWDAFPSADIGLLERGFHVGYVDAGDTYASPDALALFDSFYDHVTTWYGFSKRPVLEGLSRGGYCAYRWTYFNTDKVGCLYGDAPLCDINLLKGWGEKTNGVSDRWLTLLDSYGITGDPNTAVIEGNPIDGLATLAAAGIPIIHVCGDKDEAATNPKNNDIVQDRYPKLGGEFVLIMKEGCPHHPHGLSDPTPVVDYIVAKCADGQAAEEALKWAPKAGEIIFVPEGKW